MEFPEGADVKPLTVYSCTIVGFFLCSPFRQAGLGQFKARRGADFSNSQGYYETVNKGARTVERGQVSQTYQPLNKGGCKMRCLRFLYLVIITLSFLIGLVGVG